MKALSNPFLVFFFVLVGQTIFAQPAQDRYEAGKDAYYDGDYKKAEKLFLKTIEIREKELGKEDKLTLKVMNRLAKTYGKQRENEKAMDLFEELLEINKKVYGEESEEVASAYQEIGNIYNQMFEPDRANESYARVLNIYEKLFGEESEEVSGVLMNIGTAYHKMAEYDDAEKYYLQSFELIKKTAEPNSQAYNRIYSNMGYMYRKKGDYKKAYDYGLKALEIKLMHYDPMHPSVAKYHRNIGKALEGMNRLEEAVSYMERSAEIAEVSMGSKHVHTAGAYGELAQIYAAIGESEKALRLYKRSIEIEEEIMPLDHPYLIAGYFNTALVYMDREEWGAALELLEIVLGRLQGRDYLPRNLIARAYLEKSKAYFGKGKIEKALELCQLGLENLSDEFKYSEGDYISNPKSGDVQAKVRLLNILEYKAYCLEKFAKEKNGQYLENALEVVWLAVNTIEEMRKGFQSKESMEYLNADAKKVFEIGVRVAIDLYEKTGEKVYLWQAFQLSEKSKATILWRSMNEGMALISAGMPERQKMQIEKMERELGDLSSSFEDAQGENEQTSLRKKIFDLNLKYEKLLGQFEKEHPAFYELRYAVPKYSLSDVQEKCAAFNVDLLEYFYDENTIYVFLVNKDGLKGFSIPLKDDIATLIRTLRDFDVNGVLQNRKEKDEIFIRQLNLLYQYLISPIENELGQSSRLVIVPHGVLHYLPFEMLIKEANGTDFRKLNYLINDFSIQYAWSSALWLKEIESDFSPEIPFVGFASDFSTTASTEENENKFRYDQFGLTYAISEVEKANQYFDGVLYLREKANKKSFWASGLKGKIVHFASHAFINEENPLRSGIVFSNKVDPGISTLYAHEIYNLKMSADMAVMSACNTGYGKLAEGEGVMSLGRAFFHAGCKSVIMSQWLANDQSTSKLMANFYRYIAEGENKDEALRKAKLDYLKEADALTAHPYFWANMVAVGDMAPVSLGGTANVYCLIMIGGVMVLLFYLLVKRRI